MRLTACPTSSTPIQLIVINNWDMESIPPARKAALEDFVKKGGGLIWIAGEHNVYVDKKGREEDPLERTLPAKLAPPRSPEGTAVVLIIDKSSSMEGRKIELARLAAIGVVENLRPIDSVGVLIFDNSFKWAVPIRRADDRAAIKRLISGITPDGGTQIAPALAEAYQRILPQQAVYKHIVLLTDGISEEGRQHGARAAGAGEPRDHLDGRAGAGREPRVSRKGGDLRSGQVVLPERPFGPRADSCCATSRSTPAIPPWKRTSSRRSSSRRRSWTASAWRTPPRCAAMCVSRRAPPPTRFSRWTAPTRCWCAGSTASAAPPSSPPTPRIAGP